MKSSVSVVVIGRNEGERLGRCLRSLAALHADRTTAEVIYVDSGSVDHSISLAEQTGARVVALQPERPTAGLGRNAGWRGSGSEFVLFLDGDTELAPGFLARALECMAEPSVAVVWGHRREAHPEASLYNRVLDLDWIYPPGPAEFCGGDALFRRSVLVETGGFDETLIAGEEPELCRRIRASGNVVLHIDQPMTAHDLQITDFRQYWRRATRAGYAYAEVSARFAGTPDGFWSADARRNQWRASALLFLPLIALMSALVWRSALPVAAASVLLAALILRTAWKARWKSPVWSTLLLYGAHSHLQQIPVLFGQLRYQLNSQRGLPQGLVEYKKSL